MPGLGFGPRRGRTRAGRLAIKPLPGVGAISADGWQAVSTAPGEAVGRSFTVQRRGFDAAGGAVTQIASVTATRRVRQAYPNQVSDSANGVALADYIYATDIIAGVVNNSTEVSPKPIAAWVMPSRLLVGNAIDWELVAFHRDARNGRQVACARVRATDGTNFTGWQTVAATALSTLVEDAQPIEVYKGTLDITGLASGLVWLEAEVLPWSGDAASVLRSSDQSDPREFSRRYFTKDVALAAAPPLVYVSASGNDTSGVCSTSAAAASASPCATVSGAIAKALATTAVAGGKVDGLRVRIMAGTAALSFTFNWRRQDSAAIIIERDPASPRSACVLQQSATANPNFGYSAANTPSLTAPLTEAAVIIRDLTIQRTAAGQIGSNYATIGLFTQVWNVAWDNGGLAGVWNGVASGGQSWFGVTFTNLGSLFNYTPACPLRLLRGCTFSLGTNTTEEWVKLGNRITGGASGTFRDPTKGAIWYANKFLSPAASNATIAVQAANIGDTVSDVAIVQNLIERTDTTSSVPAIFLSGDNQKGHLVHTIVQHNVVAGYGLTGRQNLFYDEASGTTRRNHRLMRVTGNIFVQVNTKGDVFVATSQGATAEAPFRTGNFAFSHGVGCQGNWSQFATVAPAGEAQIYAGPGSNIAASASVRNDPMFTDYRGTGGAAGTPSAGTGGGDYTLQPGSPARGIVTVPVLGYDLAGVARGTGTQAAGAYG